MLSDCDLCFVTVSRSVSGPPMRGARCSSTPVELAAADLAFVSDIAGVEPEDIRGRSRDPRAVAARRAWWTLLRERGFGYAAIGRLVGRDHSSIIDGLARARECARVKAVLAAMDTQPTTDTPVMFVDPLTDTPEPVHRFDRSCRMTTSGSIDDLHAFARERLHLSWAWYAAEPEPHYVLSPKLRAKAVMLGAVEVPAGNILSSER